MLRILIIIIAFASTIAVDAQELTKEQLLQDYDYYFGQLELHRSRQPNSFCHHSSNLYIHYSLLLSEPNSLSMSSSILFSLTYGTVSTCRKLLFSSRNEGSKPRM